MKRIINRWLRAFLCLVLIGATACSDDDTEPASDVPVTPTLSTENLPDTGLKFLYSAQTVHTFTMSVDAPWEITKTAGWFVVTPTKGEAGQNIAVTVTATLNEGIVRDGEFTIRANSGNNIHPCLAEKTVSLSQDAYLGAGIVITGLDERMLVFEAEDDQPVTFKVNASYDWTLTATDESWVTVTPKSGQADVETQVSITPRANTVNEQHLSTVTITAGDAGFDENTATEVIELVQAAYMPMDTHAEGYEFFNDDFSWITANWVEPYTKYGWPSVKIDGTNGNEPSLDTEGLSAVVATQGYTYTESTYAHYEGYVKLGKTANQGAITIPALDGIDADRGATLLVRFNAAIYSSAGGTVDNGDDKMNISIVGPGTIGGLVDTETTVQIDNVWSWTRYSFVVYGATAETKITFGSERTVKCRLYLDDISVTRAKDEGAEAPAPEAIETPLDKEFINNSAPELFNAQGQVIGDGGTLKCSVRVNKAWTAETDCDWLTITSVRCGDIDPDSQTGANNGATLADGVATVKATALPYNNTKVEIAVNPGLVRTGHIIIKADGAEIENIAITQESGEVMTITGLTDNTLELGDAAGSEMQFTVKAPYSWKVDKPDTDSWYTVTPAEGAANTVTQITVKAAAQNTSFRKTGEFTIAAARPDGTTMTTEISLSQHFATLGSVKWDKSSPVQWSFSAGDMYKYSPDFNGGPADEKQNNTVMAETGPGYLSYTHTAPSDPDGKCARIVGGTGHPYITGGWPGDYWTFTVPVTSLEAGTKVHFLAITRTSGTGHKYWRMEYNDGGTWKPAGTVLNETVNGENISYTHAMNADGKTNITVDVTATYANTITDGNIEFRFVCVLNWQASGKGALENPNGGTMRWAGAGVADSPRIEIVP